ncbi:unnamed protein product [Mytilus edulis]|uniref:Uncharacterized protein n=1 Tax=Mytilus edulis TaxID=6550 RepID=A0A8S3SDV8_MYTED|nr:unnamed protein product [Mytilus edulis]
MNEPAREYFRGITLDKENPTFTWTCEEEEEDIDYLVHTLFLKQAVLGASAASGLVCLSAQQLVEYPDDRNILQDESELECTEEEDEEELEEDESPKKVEVTKREKHYHKNLAKTRKRMKMKVVDSSIKLAKNMKWAKTIQRSPGVYHPRVDRPKTPVSSTKQRRSKSAPRYHPTEKYDSPVRNLPKRLVFDDNEDGYKTDHLNPITCTCAQSETYYKCRISLLEKQQIKLENDVHRLEEEKNDLAQQLFKLASEYDKLVEENESLKTQIFNAEPDETLCLKIKSFENTIDSQKKLILEIQKRGEKNVVKTKLSGHELENDKLQCEKDQLQKCLKKQKQLAEENIKKLNKKLREKEKDLQQSNQIIDELTIKLEEIEEFPGRERNELLQQQENNKILGRENESLQAKIYELENKKGEEIDIEHKYKIKISNLKIENTRAGEKLREAGRDYETLNSRYKDQQAILSSERCRFEEELKELRLRLDEKSPKSVISVDNRWSRSATCHKEIIYKTGDEGFMDMFKRSPSYLQERDTTAGSRSDTEKENLSLKSELTVALENIEKYKQEYKDLAERYEREMKAVKKTIDSLHREKNSLEQEKKMTGKQNWIRARQNRKLENDRELLRDRIFSLKNEKIKLEELEKRLDKSTEENQLLQSEKDKLQHKLGELSTQLKKSDARYIFNSNDFALNTYTNKPADVTSIQQGWIYMFDYSPCNEVEEV